MYGSPFHGLHWCGCWYPIPGPYHAPEKKYIPQVELSSSTTILATTSRTTLRQVFINSEDSKLSEVQYTFPLYDGVSVAGFSCSVGDRTIVGVVKEKQQAKREFKEAVARGETAGLLEQLPEASDVFTTSIGNVPPKEKITVEIVYLGELKHDAETDGSRFTIPTIIAPRYGGVSTESAEKLYGANASARTGISISVDVILEEGCAVRGLQSPSHPIAVTMGRTSTMHEDAFNNNNASAKLTLGTTSLDKDFVVVVLAKGTDTPRALLETHPTIPNQRALMATLVPKFNLPGISPEIVFVVDRSGSMGGKIAMLIEAMKIFLKSLPVGVKFNICSFGSSYKFLFKKSKTYDQSSLKDALAAVEKFGSDMGGTEMFQPIEATVKNRYEDLPLEVMVLTDGEIWNQQNLFDFLNGVKNARFFSLGIGSGASSALVEGIARAGNGFAQFVGDNEKMDKRLVRMLKGALTPHIDDYTLEVTYDSTNAITADDDFEMIEAEKPAAEKPSAEKKTISLFDTSFSEEPIKQDESRYAHLPDIPIPKVLQAPNKIPTLYPFQRTTVYLLLGPNAPNQTPASVTLRATSPAGPLELSIPVQDIGTGETIHQLAAKKAVHELEQGRGWLSEAKGANQKKLKSQHEGKWDLIVEREAVRLGVQFQVGGKWCSFVAVEKNTGEKKEIVMPIREKEAAPAPAFGKPSASASSLFAAPFSNAGGLFGAPPKPAAGGSLFGAAQAREGGIPSAPAPNPFAGGGLFGGAPKPVSGGGLFGGFGSSSPSPSASLFGGASNRSSFGAAQQSNVAAVQTGGLFGTVSNTTRGGGLFGGLGNTEPRTSTSLFGAASNNGQSGTAPLSADPVPQTGSLFGGTSISSDDDDDDDADADISGSAGGARGGMRLLRARASSRSATGAFSAGPPPPPPAYAPAAPGSAAPMMSATYLSKSIDLSSVAVGADPYIMESSAPPKAAVGYGPGVGMAGGGGPIPPPPPAPAMRRVSPPSSFSSPFAHFTVAREETAENTAEPLADLVEYSAAPEANAVLEQSVASAAMADKGGAPEMLKKKSKGIGSFGASSLFSRKSSPPQQKPQPQAQAAAEPRAQAPVAPDAKMHALIALQAFDGRWNLTAELLRLVGKSKEDVASLTGSDDEKATLLAVAWLRKVMGSEEDVWEMVVEKALTFLGTAEKQLAEVEKLF